MDRNDSLYRQPAGVVTRWATPENPTARAGAGGQAANGRKGRPCVTLNAGESVLLAAATGTSGVVRRIWATIDHRSPRMLRGLRIEFFWDGAEKPAISAPMGDFFGTGLGRMVAFESAVFSSPEGRSFNCSLPMPFRTSMKIVLTNDTALDLNALYYEVNYTLGDVLLEDALYLHAVWRRERPTLIRQDFEILPLIKGAGRFLGCNVGVIGDRARYTKTWWGEGEVKIFLDGDTRLPTLCGTGTEDYIGTAWGQGLYSHLYQGSHLADMEKMRYCFYRYHIPDPIWFHRELRVSIQQIGCWDPDTRGWLSERSESFLPASSEESPIDWKRDARPNGLFERQDDWSSCGYFYLDRPTNEFSSLANLEERVVGLE